MGAVRPGALAYVLRRLHENQGVSMQSVQLAESYNHSNPADLTRVAGETEQDKNHQLIKDALDALVASERATHNDDGYHLVVSEQEWNDEAISSIVRKVRKLGEITLDAGEPETAKIPKSLRTLSELIAAIKPESNRHLVASWIQERFAIEGDRITITEEDVVKAFPDVDPNKDHPALRDIRRIYEECSDVRNESPKGRRPYILVKSNDEQSD